MNIEKYDKIKHLFMIKAFNNPDRKVVFACLMEAI